MLLNFLRIFGFYCLLHSVLIVILPTLQLFADKLWQHCVIKYEQTTAELKIHLVALCIRLRRCDGNLYWLQMLSKCRSAEEEGEKKVQTKSRYYSARIPYNTHTLTAVSHWCTLPRLLISKFVGVKNPNYSVLLKIVQHPNGFNQHKATQKSFFILRLLFFYLLFFLSFSF